MLKQNFSAVFIGSLLFSIYLFLFFIFFKHLTVVTSIAYTSQVTGLIMLIYSFVVFLIWVVYTITFQYYSNRSPEGEYAFFVLKQNHFLLQDLSFDQTLSFFTYIFSYFTFIFVLLLIQSNQLSLVLASSLACGGIITMRIQSTKILKLLFTLNLLFAFFLFFIS